MTYSLADIDDTAGFMAAARAYKQKQAVMLALANATHDASTEQEGVTNASDDGISAQSVKNDGSYGKLWPFP